MNEMAIRMGMGGGDLVEDASNPGTTRGIR